ncbi:hypothetical protein OG897_34485 [Streptomyces sp. NBC_00237]|uniref:hypothetical protein n=1 Tax=Streptomyces sp. NBC_00237 TaxID=2975687 RepID=UPI0022573E6F|nr:hypothetical protein [Streptomyces sp. NBC_00237]MCX5206501.1 hypothetical protein [Streptomyces sp. NBC_00237]
MPDRGAGPCGFRVRPSAVLPVESLDQAEGAFLALGSDIEVPAPDALPARLGAMVRELARR